MEMVFLIALFLLDANEQNNNTLIRNCFNSFNWKRYTMIKIVLLLSIAFITAWIFITAYSNMWVYA